MYRYLEKLVIVGSLVGVVACGSSEGDESSGGRPDAGTGAGGPAGGGAGSAGGDAGSGPDSGSGSVGGWTLVPLIDDTSDPRNTVLRAEQDTVTGIYFETANKGLVVTQGGRRSSTSGGAVFRATSSAITGIAYSDPTNLSPPVFVGIQRSPNGFIALASAKQLISSTDGGATFSAEQNGQSGQIEGGLALAVQISNGTTILSDNGVVSISADPAPSHTATYEIAWAPERIPPTPADLAPGQCPHGPLGAGRPRTSMSVHVSADRSFVAYTSKDEDDHPAICISTDSGRSFEARVLDVPEGVGDPIPMGVMFSDRMNGIAWWGSDVAPAYIVRTTDGGVTWKNAPLPSQIAAHEIELTAGYYAPDGKHVWLVGYDHGPSNALLIASTDGGATWAEVDGVGDAVDAARATKLYAVFALDATHVWVGGDGGVLLHN